MKSLFLKTAVLAALAVSLTACNGMTRTQRNTAAGAAIGGTTGATLGGAALGGVIGSQIDR